MTGEITKKTGRERGEKKDTKDLTKYNRKVAQRSSGNRGMERGKRKERRNEG